MEVKHVWKVRNLTAFKDNCKYSSLYLLCIEVTEKFKGTLGLLYQHYTIQTSLLKTEDSTEVMHICQLDWTRSLQQTAAKVK